MSRQRQSQKRATWRTVVILLGGLLVALPLISFGIGRQTPSLDSSLEALGFVTLEGKPIAPDFTLPDLSGKQVRLADQRGKIIFLTFWTTW